MIHSLIGWLWLLTTTQPSMQSTISTANLSLTPNDTIISEGEEPFSITTSHEVISGQIDFEDLGGELSEEELVQYRLKTLSYEMEMTHNEMVQNFIDNYIHRAPAQINDLLTRRDFYYTLFEPVLEEKGMPDVLKHLSVIESNLQPRVRSYAAAGGLWQIIPPTARHLGLNINHHVDERNDPIKSTEAACVYLQDLYEMFGDWQLALAAYNCGPGRVQSALNRSGGETFWDIYSFLPYQTRNYVPKFIATAYVMTYAEEHGYEVTEAAMAAIPATAVSLATHTDLSDFAKTFHIEEGDLDVLNPHLNTWALPQIYSEYDLNIPMHAFESVKLYQSIQNGAYEEIDIRKIEFHTKSNANQFSIKTKEKVIHQVQQGETLESIAQLYEVNPQMLLLWNRLTSDSLEKGQYLTVWVE